MVEYAEDVRIPAEEGGGAAVEVEPLREAVEEIHGDGSRIGAASED